MRDLASSPTLNDQTIYDDAAEVWWSGRRRWVRTLQNMVPARLGYFDRFIEWSDKSVLDLGCAGGFMSEALHRRGSRVTGIDPAHRAIDAARTHAAREALDIHYDVGVGEALPYADNSFDAVVCVDVLEHVVDLRRVIAEVARVLRPGGRFFYDTINRNMLATFVVVIAGERIVRLLPRGTHDPSKFIRPAELRELLEDNGFRAGPVSGLGPWGIDRRGDFTFGRLPFTGIIYMGTAQLRAH